MGMCRKAIYIYKKKRANSVIPVNYGSCQTWAAIRQYEKGLRLTRCYKSTDSHSALCCLTTSNLFLGFSFFFFKCNRAHVCTLLGIINRLKVVVEAGEEHLYAAWDEPGSAEGKTALVPSRWPAGACPPPPHIFYGLPGIYINFTKASTFMSSAGTREEWANCPRGANKMWDWNE